MGLELAGVPGTSPRLRLLNQYQFNGKERQTALGRTDYGAHDV